MKKTLCLIMSCLLITGSCQKEDLINNYPAEIRFDISYHLLDGKIIECIDVDKDGNAWIGSGTVLYYLDGSRQKSYDLEHEITDVAVSADKTVWVGSRDAGLGHFKDGKINWYNKENAGFPRDYVRSVEVATNGNVWFTSCAFNLGGLGIYNGSNFEFLTPENSPLNQNIVQDIEIGYSGEVYIATSGKVGKSNIYRITDYSWDCLGDESGTFYWVFTFSVGLSGEIFLVEDFSLSSAMNSNKFYRFRGERWEKIDQDDSPPISFISRIRSDRRSYCWLANTSGNSAFLNVFDGKKWHSSDHDLFPDNFITVIEADINNNIWVGTYNGVFILNQ